MAMNRWLKGMYQPKNPGKYAGNINKITYRSSWERTMCVWCDTEPAILRWSSETTIIPYFDPVSNKERNYFVDFRIVTRKEDGTLKVSLVEIKPHKQTIKPRTSKNKSEKTMTSELTTWLTNEAKWKAAKVFCRALGWEFFIITEKILFGDIDKAAPSRPQSERKKAPKG